MAYISPIAIETALRSVGEAAPEAVRHDHAVEAAHILLANSPRHARRFALAMHSRVARGINTNVVEHWARVAVEIARISGKRRMAASPPGSRAG